MPDLRPGFMRIRRDTGSDALIRADSITAVLHNTMTVRDGGEKREAQVLSIHLGPTVVIHTEMAEEVFMKIWASAAGIASVTVSESDIPSARG